MGNLASFYDPNRECYTIQADIDKIDYKQIAELANSLRVKLLPHLGEIPQEWTQHLADSFCLYGSGVLNGAGGIQWNRMLVADRMNLVVLISSYSVKPKTWSAHD